MLIFVVLILLVIIVLTGCTSVPVNRKFPEAPSKIVMEGCPNLEKIKDDAKLSDVAKTVTTNYSTYYECAVKVDTWVEWYQIQKTIFESIK
jgi:CDP-diacylglycerol pyrophosphatase